MTHPLQPDAALEAVTAELAAHEPLFHRLSPDAGRADLEALTVESFWEIGASGSPYGREFAISTVLERLAADAPDAWRCEDFRAQRLADDLVLLTYELDQSGHRSRRTTLWRHTPTGWRAAFHQGTLIPGRPRRQR